MPITRILDPVRLSGTRTSAWHRVPEGTTSVALIGVLAQADQDDATLQITMGLYGSNDPAEPPAQPAGADAFRISEGTWQGGSTKPGHGSRPPRIGYESGVENFPRWVRLQATFSKPVTVGADVETLP